MSNNFETIVQVYLDLPEKYSLANGFDHEHAKDARAAFELEIEYRSYGIKGTSVFLRGLDEITLTLQKLDNEGDVAEEKDHVIAVDVSKLREAGTPWNIVIPTDIFLVLNDDLSVNYEKSEWRGEGLPSGQGN